MILAVGLRKWNGIMTDYIPLEKLYYRESSSDPEATTLSAAEKRLKDTSTFRTGIEIKAGELFLAVPKELTSLNDRLLRVERKVSLLWHELPGIAHGAYLRGLIFDEIVSTNEIEGIRSTRRQIQESLAGAAPKHDTSPQKRFREFAKLYLELTDKNHVYPQTPADLRKIYEAVVAGELEENQQPDGELFRKEGADVLDSTQKVIHRGVTPESAIKKMLGQMIALADSSDIPPTFAAIITHFLFEYIHPFYDGNGRMGRYLLALYLSGPLSLPTALSLSKVIAENKSKYYKAFKAAEAPRNYGEITFFVIQMMEFISLAQDDVIANLEKKKGLLQKAEEALPGLKKAPLFLTDKETKIMFLAVQNFLFGAITETSLQDISQYSGSGLQTARKYVSRLEDKGLLQSLSLRPLTFALTAKAFMAFGLTED